MFNKYILEITAFLSGAIVMIFELVGSRVFAPYFGTSIFVWTSLIGIILGSLSVGYYFGGRIADNNASIKNLAAIVFLASVFVGFTIVSKDILLTVLRYGYFDTRVGLILSSLFLFAPASMFLGMVSPYVVKLKIISLNTSGKTVGSLYAISTVGSITGTFLSGFYLIPYFGTNTLLNILAFSLAFLSFILYFKSYVKTRVIMLSVILFSSLLVNKMWAFALGDSFVDVDTSYSRIWIYNHVDSETNKTVKKMGINNESHSAKFLESDELVYEYTKYYHLVRHFNPNFETVLMFGGAGYSFPKDYLKVYPDKTIDVVEIDPAVTFLAKKYFSLVENPRLNIYHEDGRIYLNRTDKKYDVIFGDAFSSHYSVPYQLTTIEAVQKKFEILNDGGVVILNIISALEGEKGKFFRAEYATYKKVFSQVYVFPVANLDDADMVQNMILVALKSDKKPDLESNDSELNKYLSHLWKGEIILDVPVLTDDYAPVDYYINKAI